MSTATTDISIGITSSARICWHAFRWPGYPPPKEHNDTAAPLLPGGEEPCAHVGAPPVKLYSSPIRAVLL